MNNLSKKGVALLQIFILAISIFAFILNLTIRVNAESEVVEVDGKPVKAGSKISYDGYTGTLGFYGDPPQPRLIREGMAPIDILPGTYDKIKILEEITTGTLPLAPPLSVFWPKGVAATVPGYIIQGLSWAATVVGVIQLFKAAGLDENIANSLSYGAAAGIMSGNAKR